MQLSKKQADRLSVGLLFVLAVFAAGCQYFQKPEHEKIYVTASALNLRAKPTTQASIVGRLDRGQELTLLKKSDPWLQVKIDDGTTGWVHGDYVGDSAAVRAALKKDLAQRSSKRAARPMPPPQTMPQAPTHTQTAGAFSIDQMLNGMPDDFEIEEMDPIDGQPRHMGAAANGQVVVEFWGPRDDLQHAEIMVTVVDVSDADLQHNAEDVLRFVRNAVPQWKRDAAWVVEFLKNLSSKDVGNGGFDTREKKVRFLFVKPLGSIRVSIEKTG